MVLKSSMRIHAQLDSDDWSSAAKCLTANPSRYGVLFKTFSEDRECEEEKMNSGATESTLLEYFMHLKFLEALILFEKTLKDKYLQVHLKKL
jgi:hypothetical protein